MSQLKSDLLKLKTATTLWSFALCLGKPENEPQFLLHKTKSGIQIKKDLTKPQGTVFIGNLTLKNDVLTLICLKRLKEIDIKKLQKYIREKTKLSITVVIDQKPKPANGSEKLFKLNKDIIRRAASGDYPDSMEDGIREYVSIASEITQYSICEARTPKMETLIRRLKTLQQYYWERVIGIQTASKVEVENIKTILNDLANEHKNNTIAEDLYNRVNDEFKALKKDLLYADSIKSLLNEDYPILEKISQLKQSAHRAMNSHEYGLAKSITEVLKTSLDILMKDKEYLDVATEDRKNSLKLKDEVLMEWQSIRNIPVDESLLNKTRDEISEIMNKSYGIANGNEDWGECTRLLKRAEELINDLKAGQQEEKEYTDALNKDKELIENFLKNGFSQENAASDWFKVVAREPLLRIEKALTEHDYLEASNRSRKIVNLVNYYNTFNEWNKIANEHCLETLRVSLETEEEYKVYSEFLAEWRTYLSLLKSTANQAGGSELQRKKVADALDWAYEAALKVRKKVKERGKNLPLAHNCDENPYRNDELLITAAQIEQLTEQHPHLIKIPQIKQLCEHLSQYYIDHDLKAWMQVKKQGEKIQNCVNILKKNDENNTEIDELMYLANLGAWKEIVLERNFSPGISPDDWRKAVTEDKKIAFEVSKNKKRWTEVDKIVDTARNRLRIYDRLDKNQKQLWDKCVLAHARIPHSPEGLIVYDDFNDEWKDLLFLVDENVGDSLLTDVLERTGQKANEVLKGSRSSPDAIAGTLQWFENVTEDLDTFFTNAERYRDLIGARRFKAVSYTHLTLPTTPYV